MRTAVTRHATALGREAQELRSAVTLRLKYWPLLAVALIGYVATVWLVTSIRPAFIQHWLFPDSFLPFHILFFFANFFFFTFLTVRKRWGLFIALTMQWLLLLKLQNFAMDGWAVGSALIIGAGGYGLRTFTKKRE
jgi:hypothetical protein